MKRTVLGAAFAVTGIIAMTTAASAQVCVLGIFGAAIYVAATEKRELTQKEAMTCGLSRLFEDKKDAKAAETKPKKVARRTRKTN